VFCAALVLVTVLFYSNVLYWHGDPSWGPRYLYVVVPYLVLPLGEILAAWRRTHTALRAATVLLIACSLALQVSAVSVTQWRFWYRLQAAEEQTSQKFQWGASHYHYYWTVADSPIPMQIDDVYQVARLNLGDQKYRLTRKPGSLVHSNPAQDYPVNTVAFWWADTRHPLLGPRTRAAIAAGLGMLAIGCLVLLLLTLTGRASGSRERLPGDFELEPA
jgi:hypothetical protein